VAALVALSRTVSLIRQEIERLLREEPRSALDLSKLVGISEREVPDHLSHLERSLRRRGATLHVEPVRCLGCGFVFAERRRFTRPGRCPGCRGRRLTLPRFSVS
jgi:predicted Zn-ribbon and HTH transcriptional regulator